MCDLFVSFLLLISNADYDAHNVPQDVVMQAYDTIESPEILNAYLSQPNSASLCFVNPALRDLYKFRLGQAAMDARDLGLWRLALDLQWASDQIILP